VVAEIDPATGKEREEPFLSRSVLFILSVALICASAVVILLGTRPDPHAVTGKPSQVATASTTSRNAPVAILIGLLIAPRSLPLVAGEAPKAGHAEGVRRFAIGVLGAGVAFSAGVRGAKDLAFIGFAVFGCAANVESVVLFVRRKVVASAGGYLAHIGVAIMLVGILISGAYEKKTQVTLVRGEPTQVGGRTMTFTRTVLVNEDGDVKSGGARTRPGSRTAAPSRRWRSRSRREGEGLEGLPEMFQNERTQQLMANPDVRSTPLMDLYLSPQSYDPGSPSRIEGIRIASSPARRSRWAACPSREGLHDGPFADERQPAARHDEREVPRGAGGKTTETTAQLVMFMAARAAARECSRRRTSRFPARRTARFRVSRVGGNDGSMEIESSA